MDGEYFGPVFGRPSPGTFPSLTDDAPPNADMWATKDESSDYLIDLYARVWKYSQETIAGLDLSALGIIHGPAYNQDACSGGVNGPHDVGALARDSALKM
jgi:hypothetical protein